MDDQIKQSPTTRRVAFSAKAVVVLFALIFVVVLAIVMATAAPESFWNRVLTVGLVFLILGLALFDNIYEALQKERAWGKLAGQTGLTCQMDGSFFNGYSVQVTGTYQGRAITLSTYKQGKSQVPSTHIELKLKNETKASFRLRGPFSPGEATTDKVVSDLFEATAAREFGADRRFFIRSRPVHLVTAIFRPGPLQTKLRNLELMVNIELEGRMLHFNQMGVLGDTEYLSFIFDLLSDLADTIERGRSKLVSS